MKSQNLGLRVASIVFGFMSVVQLARLITRPEVLVAGDLFRYGQVHWPS